MKVKEQFHNDAYPRQIERYYLLLMNGKFIAVSSAGMKFVGTWSKGPGLHGEHSVISSRHLLKLPGSLITLML